MKKAQFILSSLGNTLFFKSTKSTSENLEGFFDMSKEDVIEILYPLGITLVSLALLSCLGCFIVCVVKCSKSNDLARRNHFPNRERL